MLDHLWQSTLFAAAIWIVATALRRNGAALRYRLWMAASLKFLVPFGALISVGARFAWHSAPAATTAWPLMVEEVFSPQATVAATPAGGDAALSHAAAFVPAALMAVWAAGSAVVLFAWWRQWRAVRAALARATSADPSTPAVDGIAVLSSPDRVEPGLVGVWRPVLLLPSGLCEHIPPDGLNAILAHERCHLRRRDNLTAALHMAVEAIFWFHPAVWWIETRLVEERERACDEAVLSSGAAPHAYAEAILTVCRYYVESPTIAAAGVTGANLERRIESIVSNERARPLGRFMTATIAVLAVCVTAAPVALGAMVASRPAAQAPAVPSGPLSFQAASIKPNKSLQGDRASGFQPGGRFVARNMALRNLIAIAYGEPAPLPLVRVLGGPDWLDSDRYDIEAKSDANFPETAAQPGFSSSGEQMLRTLLVERFKLAAHTESREMAVYALVPARADRPRPSGLVASTGADCTMPPVLAGAGLPPCGLAFVPDADPGVRHYRARNVTMEQLARSFSAFIGTGIDRVIVDRTRLDKGFSFDLRFAPPAAGGSPDIGISIFTAFQEQLGLRLEPTRAPVNIVVIDHAERLPDDSAQVTPAAVRPPVLAAARPEPSARPQPSLRPQPSPASQTLLRQAAADTTGAIVGIVTDSSSNEPLANVVVEVATGDPPDKPRTMITDVNGAFAVDGLAPGTYIVVLHHDEYTTFKREGLTVEAGRTARMAVPLRYSPIRD